MMGFTTAQIRYVLNLIAKEHGEGYAAPEAILEDGSTIGSLQAGLSIMLQVASEREAREK